MTPDDIVDWLSADPASTGLFVDFDGTISPIVNEPEAAQPLAGVVETLHALAAHLASVAVVSGRPARFLVDRLGLEGSSGRLLAYGLHGLEQASGAEVAVAEAAAPWLPALRAAWDELVASAPAGLDLEDKGFGLTLHWRLSGSPEVAAQSRALAERVAEAHGLFVRPGRASAELVPPVGIDKGSVVLAEAERLAAAGAGVPRLSFIGDDVGDELAFEALGSLERAGRADVLRVAVGSSEIPERLVRLADVVVADPPEAAAVLKRTLGRLEARGR